MWVHIAGHPSEHYATESEARTRCAFLRSVNYCAIVSAYGREGR